jgi:hypothetical protein
VPDKASSFSSGLVAVDFSFEKLPEPLASSSGLTDAGDASLVKLPESGCSVCLELAGVVSCEQLPDADSSGLADDGDASCV